MDGWMGRWKLWGFDCCMISGFEKSSISDLEMQKGRNSDMKRSCD
jgi:hypothetical protein